MQCVCASLGLCQLKTAVCRTVILSNGLSLPADVLDSTAASHMFSRCWTMQLYYFSLLGAPVLLLVVADSFHAYGPISLAPLHPEYSSSTLAILGPEMSPVG